MAEDRQQQRRPSENLAADVSPEEQSERVERLRAMQWESLSSSRRDEISKMDYRENRDTPSSRILEATRRVNQAGTEEWSAAREKKADLSKWTNAWQDLNDDGTAEEDLEDIAGGQTHRLKLAEAEAQARKKGVSPHEDTKSQHKGGYNATRSDRARGGGVAGTRGRGDGRRGSAREFASRSMSTPSGPFETLGARTRTTTRDDGSRDKRVPAPNPLSTTAGSSSRGRAASRQTAHGSVASTPGREKLPTSANRQVSARSQRPSSNYEAFLAPPETFIATYQSRLGGRQAATATDLSLSDANTSSGVPSNAPQEVVEPKAASTGERSVTRESSVHSNMSVADSSVVFSPEIDSAPVGIRVPTPPPPGTTASEVSGEGSYLIDLVGLEWQEGVPTASRESAAESPNTASEDVEILSRSHPDQVIPSSDALRQLALLLPSIRRELDPSIVAQLEALAARGLTQSQTSDSGRQTTSSVPMSGDKVSGKPEATSMDTVGLTDSRFAQPTASSNRVSAGQFTGHIEGLRTAWTRNVEAGDYEAVKDIDIIIGEHVYRSAATSKGSTNKANPIAARTTVLNPFSPMPESALQRVPEVQSVGRPSPLSTPFLGTLESAGDRVSQVQSLVDSHTRARATPQAHPDTATERSNVLSSTIAESAAMPIAPEDRSSRDELSSHMPARPEAETEASVETGFLGSPPLEGNLTRSVYASSGHTHARQQSFKPRARTSGSDDIIGEHLLPNSQRHSFGEGPGHDGRAPTAPAHTWFTNAAAHTRFGSPATLRIIPATVVAATPSTAEPLTLELSRLSFETDNVEVAVGHRGVEEGTVAGPYIVRRSEPTIPTVVATSQYGASTRTMPNLLPVSIRFREGATASTSNHPTSIWDQVGHPLLASASSRHLGSSAVAATFPARHSNASRGRGGYNHQQAPQLPAFLANNPAPSSDPGAAAARQYGLDRPRSPTSSQSARQVRERDDAVSDDSVDLQASIFAAPYTGPPTANRPTINSSGFLKTSDDVEPSDSSRGLRSKKDPWDMARKYGSGS